MQQPIQLRKGQENVSVPCLKMNGLMWMWLLLKGGSINYHRKVFFMSVFLRFVILRSLFGSIYLFVQSYSSLYSFTHK